MKKLSFILPVVLFLVIVAEEVPQEVTQEIPQEILDAQVVKPNYANYFDKSDIENIVEVIKSGDAYALEYAFKSSEKKMLGFQKKYLLTIIDTSIDRLSKKTLTNEKLAQIGAVLGTLYYLEKTNYLKGSEKGFKLGTGEEVITDKIKQAASILLTPLRKVSEYRSGLITTIKNKIYPPKEGVTGLSDKSYFENLLGDNAFIKGIVAAVIITVAGKLIIDGIYATSGTINSKVSDIFLYRKHLNKLYKIKDVIIKQEVAL